MNNDTMVVHELWMRNTSKDGSAYVSEHWVWDADRFVTARTAEAKKAGGKAEQITQDQYKQERKQ